MWWRCFVDNSHKKTAQFDKNQIHILTHTKIYACTHTLHTYTHTNLNIFPPDLSLPRCNRINEPITGYGSSHRFKRNQDYYPSPILSLYSSLCVCMCPFMHGWDQWENMSQSVLCCAVPTSTYHGGQWPYQPSYLAVLSSKKTRENEGSNASLQVYAAAQHTLTSHLPPLFTSCSTVLSSCCLLQCSNRQNVGKADDLGGFNTDYLEQNCL